MTTTPSITPQTMSSTQCELRQGCPMARVHGPFADGYLEYQRSGWQGTLPLPKLEKNDPPRGFTGQKFIEVWPTESDLHMWSHESSSNLGLRLPNDIIGIDVDQYIKKGRPKTGHDRLVVLEKTLGELPPTWRSTRRGYSNPSGIRFFRVPADKMWPGVVDIDVEVIQHRHRYAVVWPSVVPDTETGEVMQYQWFTPEGEVAIRPPSPSELPELPEAWVRHLWQQARVSGSVTVRSGDYPIMPDIPDEVDTSAPWYLKALARPDASGRGNQTMVSVVGGIAKMFVESGLPYEAAVATALGYERSSIDPQPDETVLDRLQYFWAVEMAKKRERDEATPFSTLRPQKIAGDPTGAPGDVTTGVVSEAMYDDEDRGYLAERIDGKVGYSTITIEMSKNGPKPVEVIYSDFEIEAVGVSANQAGDGTTWVVNITKRDGTVLEDVELPSKTLSSTNTARGWFADRGCILSASDDKKYGPMGLRLLRNLQWQNPASFRVTDHLGWDDRSGTFVTYEGAITANGINQRAEARPSRGLKSRKLVNHHYGFGDEERTKELLREILTFHDSTFTSVHAAWMCAAVLKGHLMRKSSLFPIFLVEAASESGKTTGYAQLIRQLFGDLSKEEGVGTRASIRNALTAHRGAPVRIDDADELDSIKEILRQVPNEGAVDKSGEDNQSTVRAKLVAPVWISCEGSGIRGEKAMMDRVVTCDLPNPKGRMSLKDPSRTQWDDIVDFMGDHCQSEFGLTEYSGTLVQMILRESRLIEEFGRLRKASGRYNDKLAVLKVGARVLASVTGDESHIVRVDEWCDTQIDTGDENALTMTVIPAAITALGIHETPMREMKPPYYNIPAPVVFLTEKDGSQSMWVHIKNLASWWEKHRNGRIEERTETATALQEQSARIGMRGGKAGVRNRDWKQVCITDTLGGKYPNERIYIVRIPDKYRDVILERLGLETSEERVQGTSKLTPGQVIAIGRSAH